MSDGTNFALDFAPGQPDNYLGLEDCVHYSSNTSIDHPGLAPFNDAPCFYAWAISACQAAPLPCYPALKRHMGHTLHVPVIECLDGYTQFNGLCYKLHPETQSYDAAQQACAKEGATLMEPRNQADRDLLSSEWGPLGKR